MYTSTFCPTAYGITCFALPLSGDVSIARLLRSSSSAIESYFPIFFALGALVPPFFLSRGYSASNCFLISRFCLSKCCLTLILCAFLDCESLLSQELNRAFFIFFICFFSLFLFCSFSNRASRILMPCYIYLSTMLSDLPLSISSTTSAKFLPLTFPSRNLCIRGSYMYFF